MKTTKCIGILLAIVVTTFTHVGSGAAYLSYTLIAQTGQLDQSGQVGITSFLGGPTINNDAYCAFPVKVSGPYTGQGIFAGDGSQNPEDITPNLVVQTFSSFLQINDSYMVVAEDTFSGSPASYYIRTWDANMPGSYANDAKAVNGGFVGEPSINNGGQIAYIQFDGTNTYYLYVTNAVSPAASYSTTLGNNVYRPMIADNGAIVGKLGTGPVAEGSITVYFNQNPQSIAAVGDANGFTSLDSLPGISDDGQVVAFNGTGPSGPGIYIATADSTGSFANSTPFLVAGAANGFTAFQSFSRVGVATTGIPTPYAPPVGNVAYIGTQQDGTVGLYVTSFVSQGPANAPVLPNPNPSPVVTVGQSLGPLTLGGLTFSGSVTSITIQDPLDTDGDVAFMVNTDSGAQAVLVAPPLSIQTCNATTGQPIPPLIEPSILNIPNGYAAGHPNLFPQRREAMLLKISNGPPSGLLTAFITPIASSGGHDGTDHNTMNRPHGWLMPSYDPSFPPFAHQAEWQPTGTTDYSDLGHSFNILLDANGNGNLYYYAPELSGQDIITISTTDGSKFTTVTNTIGVELPAGQSFTPFAGGQNINLTGQTYNGLSIHPNNHYGTPTLIQALTALGINWSAQYQRDNNSLPEAQLPVNDMSLVNGGEFEVNNSANAGSWQVVIGGPGYAGHQGHRLGIEVDIGDHNFPSFLPNIAANAAANETWGGTFNRMWAEEGWFSFVSEGNGRFYHFILTGNGYVVMDSPDPAQVLAWNPATGNATIRVPLENRGGLDADNVRITAITVRPPDLNVAIVGPNLPNQLGPAPIREPEHIDVQLQIPNGVANFELGVQGDAIGGSSPVNLFGDFWKPVHLGNPVPMVHASPVFGNQTGPIITQNVPCTSSWQVVVTNASQPALTNGTVVYSGLIINNTGTNILLGQLDLYFSMAAPAGSFHYDFAPQFLDTGGVISPSGYAGPLFVITWSNSPTVGAIGTGSFQLSATTNLNLPPQSGSFSSFYEPQILKIGFASANVTVSWPASGSNLMLTSFPDIGATEFDWSSYLPPAVLTNGQNTVTIPATDPTAFFQLFGPY